MAPTGTVRRLLAGVAALAVGVAAAQVATSAPASAAAACPAGSSAVASSSPLICQVSITSTPPSGTWTVPAGVTSVDVVVVGAGGGGNGAAAGKAGGGGGGGEVTTSQSLAVVPGTGVVVSVGSGGFGGSSASPAGMAGGSSSFGAVTARGGADGSGGPFNGNASGNVNVGGAATADTAGGGGGGAGGAGSAASSVNGATGGVGIAPTSGLFAGNTTKYGGGGGGGSVAGTAGSGTDGGGAGGSAAFPIADPGGVGAGGGGAGPGGFGGFGGSGTVIVRFRQSPAAPTSLVATPQDGAASIAFTPGADGTSTISNYEYTLDDSTWIALGPAVTTSPVTIPTLTNGSTYSVKLRAVSPAGNGTASSAVSVTPGVVPTAPTGLSATGGNASASIAFTAGAPGTLPIDNYEHSIDGGTTWTALSPAVTASPVTLTGLTNGTAYSIQLRAVSAIGPGAASTAVSVTPVAPPTPRPPRPVPTPTPRPVPVPPLTPGGSAVTVDGQPQQVTSGPNAQGDGVDISGEGFAMTVQGLDGEGDPLGLGPDGALTLEQDRGVRTSGSGFRGSSQVDFYLDPPSPVTTRSDGVDTGITLGTATTGALGDFASTVTLPAGVATGDHVLQIVGVTPLGRLRAVSLGVRVEPDASITLVKGQRIDEGRHDRIAATGTVSGLPAGTLLTPYVRLEGRTAFVAGMARILVQSDGSFRWSRLVRADRDVTAFVAWADVQSNEVTWLKLSP